VVQDGATNEVHRCQPTADYRVCNRRRTSGFSYHSSVAPGTPRRLPLMLV
jgi:hypothetical protein